MTETELTTSTLTPAYPSERTAAGSIASKVPHWPHDVHLPVRVMVENPQLLQT
jgi:hypothetical protein